MSNPRWPRDRIADVEAKSKKFQRELSQIAELMAQHEGAETILSSHIDQSFRALSQLGLQRQRWYANPSAEVAYGFTTLGLATVTQDFISAIIPESPARASAISAITIGLIIVGAGIVVHGWLRGSGKR